jgi:hypothetical protein
MTNIEVPPKPERDVIREVDWLAVAPWLLILRCPLTAAHPIAWGLGAVLVFLTGVLRLDNGDYTSWWDLCDRVELRQNVVQGVTWPISFAGEILTASAWWLAGEVDGSARDVAMHLLGMAIGVAVGAVISALAARRLTEPDRTRSPFKLRSAVSLAVRSISAVMLAAAPPLSFLILAGLLLLPTHWEAMGLLAWVTWPLVVVIAGLAAITGFAFVIGTPLVLAAIAVDDADMFDAVSRAYAYAIQRPASLAWYLLVAAVVGAFSGLLLESGLLTIWSVLDVLNLRLAESGKSAAQWWEHTTLVATRGFYIAYFFTAMTSIYLLLRRDIDGQPMDEIAHAEGAA